MLECLKELTAIAPVFTATASIGAFALALVTLLYLKKDHQARFRPYVFAVVLIEPFPDKKGGVVSICPQNLGAHPCKVKLSDITLAIGDETYDTPSFKEWIPLGAGALRLQVPAGHVNEVGAQKWAEARYRKNRIDVSFKVSTASVDDRFKDEKSYVYELDFAGQTPQALYRPEWV